MSLFSLGKKIVVRLSATQQITLSFAFVILSGGLLLWLPISNNASTGQFINHLFTATSAVCVTGLVTVIPVDQYTIFGQFIIILLMQIGGLGLMTLLAVFLVFVGGKLSHADKLVMQEAVNRNTLSNFSQFLKFIIRYTLIFEGTGFILLSFRFVKEFGWGLGLFRALFVAVSAFCNAGIDNIGKLNLLPYVSDPLVSLTVSILIIMGGLGFSVWFDLTQSTKSILKRKLPFKVAVKHLRPHTKLVLIMTSLLIGSGTLFILWAEYSNPGSIRSLDFGSKLLSSFFQSVTLRTAGFSTLDIGKLRPVTQVLMMFYMFIGGSPGGTAGGIKTTTFAILILLVIAEIRGQSKIVIFKRSISRETSRKAFVIAFALLLTLLVGITLLTITENQTFLALCFEATSAIATVGLSMGITMQLTAAGKLIIIALMYLGRIGPLTLILSLGTHRNNAKINDINYPDTTILIG